MPLACLSRLLRSWLAIRPLPQLASPCSRLGSPATPVGFLAPARRRPSTLERAVAPSASISLKDIDALLNVNVCAQTIASKAALATSARAAELSPSEAVSQTASRRRCSASMRSQPLVAFTKGLARELGPKEITVNLVQLAPSTPT
jgi:hypothetical protein